MVPQGALHNYLKNKKKYETSKKKKETQPHIHLCNIYGYFSATKADLNSCNRDYMAQITKSKIFTIQTFYRKTLQTSWSMAWEND